MNEGGWRAEAEDLRRLAPRHVLFLSPRGVTVSSAGSQPSGVNPFAIGDEEAGTPRTAPFRPTAVTPGLQSQRVTFLSVREIAARLGVCTSTVYMLCNEGKLAHLRVSNAIRVSPDAVNALRATTLSEAHAPSSRGRASRA